MPVPSRAQALRTIGRIDRFLSEAQNFTAEISNMETKGEAPKLYDLGDKAWDDIEKIRRRLRDFVERIDRRDRDRRREPPRRDTTKTIATASSLAEMQKHVDKYYYIPGYRINPTTLKITSPSNVVVTGVRITRQPGGYRFECTDCGAVVRDRRSRSR